MMIQFSNKLTREYNVAVELLANVNVALHDRVVGGLVHTIILLADQWGLEQHLGTAKALISDCDNLPI